LSTLLDKEEESTRNRLADDKIHIEPMGFEKIKVEVALKLEFLG